MSSAAKNIHKLSAAGVLISLGIIFGDIGTSPIYVISAIVGDHVISRELILGGLSCVFWTLVIITTFKYVILALNNDNRGEGGIFALYAIHRRFKVKWAIVPALVGCAALIADGFITPPISISSAIEGLKLLNPNIDSVVPIVIIAMIILFTVQQFGTNVVGKAFGPVMSIWFLMIGILGSIQVVQHPEVLEALNPYWAIHLLTEYKGGFWLLGSVFLCTTGAEAMYSDLGHCGKQNIRFSWTFVLTMLLLNYAGQSAYMLTMDGQQLNDHSPFYMIMPTWFLPIGIIVATSATMIASQAILTGCFTLVNEAMKLKLWTNFKVVYPSTVKGQIYIPAINWFLFAGCVTVVLLFREAKHMEAAYGLAITFDMIMTTVLLTSLMLLHKRAKLMVFSLAALFLLIEGSFLVSNLNKFTHGGWFTVSLAVGIFFALWIFYEARKLRAKHTEFVEIDKYLPAIQDLMHDESIAKEATHLVYLSMVNDKNHIDSNIIYSIFRKKPKRADVYWFVHVDISNDPYLATYSVDTIVPKKIFFVRLRFGFKVEHKVNVMFRRVVEEMVAAGEVDLLSNYPSLRKHGMYADFKFILLNSRVSIDNKLSPWEQIVIKGYRFFKSLSLPTHEDFGLELTNVEYEMVPIKVSQEIEIKLERVTK
ncbi:MAG TPA: KUP/HAK/KT family potassium transporter [Chitinophagales bacterium]|nr:KUP/HAK/KT family potassium transporter [Chitinophagales bacterium]HMX05400.1 KUP/HAK/KT family potassium transporter [Chitinophagales bacterium]HMZ88601.1 KUP/HAK/KT family potassium transporter [Chitinophagales bacterium]HNE44676.1 KUP/HAK/KT family potassium transporter [Chitinophagales bacterium]HNF68232.1 KUP/HAK/KT family potassium transporter [Chitinophagales bacterium]